MNAKPGKLGGFDFAAGATPPTSPAANERPAAPAAGNGQEPAMAPVPPAPAAPSRPARQARQRAETPAPEPAGIDPATRNLWRTLLQNSARKLARDRAQVATSEAAWPTAVAQARALGVPEHVIVEAAAGADVEVPE